MQILILYGGDGLLFISTDIIFFLFYFLRTIYVVLKFQTENLP